VTPEVKAMETNPEIRERILAAAAQLFEQSGRKELPTVDSVRKLSRTSMNDASAVMREWRRSQIVAASAAVVSVPERVSQASAAALSTLWGEAQELANESLNVAQAAWDAERAEAEKLRVELSLAFETQGAELEAERKQLGVAREGLAAVSTELVTVKARAQAQGEVQLEQAERLKRVEAELTQARAATAAAREEAAQLRGQAEALTNQHAELMRVIQDRDGERNPKGGKKS
jgi:hypothetical protein